MKTQQGKRGRPPKRGDRRKAEVLDIRLAAAEKQAFRDAAELAGLDLSAWVRERLRTLARKELESAGQAVAFMSKASLAKPDHLAEAMFIASTKAIKLRFQDNKTYYLKIGFLEMPVNRIRWESAAASLDGHSMMLKGIKNDEVPIDASTLRYLVDKKYAKKIDTDLENIEPSDDEVERIVRENPPSPEWFAEPGRDLTRESWK